MTRVCPQNIIDKAIEDWQPSNIVCLFSGGYDSMTMAHLCHSLDMHGIPLHTWAIDTKLSADGWIEYVAGVAEELQFQNFGVWDNDHGYQQYVQWVTRYGCPRGRGGHNRAYTRLKDRAIDAIHMHLKQNRNDKTLFLSGMRKYESAQRTATMHFEVQRAGTSNKIYANPLFWWTDEDVARYRIEYDLPDNPFYNTVKGSGDCQCNWGNFITLGTLRQHSPRLADGNVGELDRISRERHGYGWDGELDMEPLFPLEGMDAEFTTPFLCSNCSRQGNKVQAVEEVMLQRGMF